MILTGQKFMINAENGQFGRAFKNLKLEVKQCYQTSQERQQKLVENAKMSKIQKQHFKSFSNNVHVASVWLSLAFLASLA